MLVKLARYFHNRLAFNRYDSTTDRIAKGLSIWMPMNFLGFAMYGAIVNPNSFEGAAKGSMYGLVNAICPIMAPLDIYRGKLKNNLIETQKIK